MHLEEGLDLMPHDRGKKSEDKETEVLKNTFKDLGVIIGLFSFI